MMPPNPTRSVFTPEVIFTSGDELAPPTTLIKAARLPMKRKFSFPVSLHASSLLSSDSNPIGRTTRRLSNVSDRVTDRVRKLSSGNRSEIWKLLFSLILIFNSDGLASLTLERHSRLTRKISHNSLHKVPLKALLRVESTEEENRPSENAARTVDRSRRQRRIHSVERSKASNLQKLSQLITNY